MGEVVGGGVVENGKGRENCIIRDQYLIYLYTNNLYCTYIRTYTSIILYA